MHNGYYKVKMQNLKMKGLLQSPNSKLQKEYNSWDENDERMTKKQKTLNF